MHAHNRSVQLDHQPVSDGKTRRCLKCRKDYNVQPGKNNYICNSCTKSNAKVKQTRMASIRMGSPNILEQGSITCKLLNE